MLPLHLEANYSIYHFGSDAKIPCNYITPRISRSEINNFDLKCFSTTKRYTQKYEEQTSRNIFKLQPCPIHKVLRLSVCLSVSLKLKISETAELTRLCFSGNIKTYPMVV